MQNRLTATVKCPPWLGDALREATDEVNKLGTSYTSPAMMADAGEILTAAVNHPSVRDALLHAIKDDVVQSFASQEIESLREEREKYQRALEDVEGRIETLKQNPNAVVAESG